MVTESEHGGLPIIKVSGGLDSFFAFLCSFKKNVDTTSVAPSLILVCLKVLSLRVLVRITSMSGSSLTSSIEIR